MASPVVAQVVENSTNTAGTNHTINHPTVVAGQLWLIILDKGSTSATVNAHADWTELLDEASANGLYIAYRWTTGGEGASTTLVTSASTRTASHVYRITGAENPATQAPQIGTTSSGTSATPDPPASAAPPSSKDYLFIAFFGAAGEEADDDTWSDTPPTNYTPSPPRQKACGVAGTNLGGMIAAAERALTTGVAENPGTFAKDVSVAWRAQTITVHPAASVTNFQTLSATGVGVASISDVETYLRTLSATAIGVSVLTPAILFSQALAATAVGVATLSSAVTYVSSLIATAVGLASLSRVATFFRSLSVVAAVQAVLSTVPDIAGGVSTIVPATVAILRARGRR